MSPSAKPVSPSRSEWPCIRPVIAAPAAAALSGGGDSRMLFRHVDLRSDVLRTAHQLFAIKQRWACLIGVNNPNGSPMHRTETVRELSMEYCAAPLTSRVVCDRDAFYSTLPSP